MKKRLMLGLACAGLVAAAPVFAQSNFGIVLHMEDDPSGLFSCSSVDDATLTCDAIQDTGTTNQAVLKKVWVIVYGWENATPSWPAGQGLGGVEFGIMFDEGTVFPVLWTVCTGGFDLPAQGFPGFAGSGTATSWAGGAYDPPGDFAKVGFITLSPGSTGRMTIAVHPSTLVVKVSSAAVPGPPMEFVVPGAGYSSADVAGTNPDDGRRACDEAVPTVASTWSRLKATYGSR